MVPQAPIAVFIIYAHPEPKSFNGALLHAAISTFQEKGDRVVVSDLYRLQFQPVSDQRNFRSRKDPDFFKQQLEEIHATETDTFAADIEAELRKVETCDLMLWQFPLWWFGLPAILKGWVDRVFAMGRTYGNGRFYDQGVFGGKKALLSLTTGGGPEHYRTGGFNGDIESILRPIQRGMLYFVGFEVLRPTSLGDRPTRPSGSGNLRSSTFRSGCTASIWNRRTTWASIDHGYRAAGGFPLSFRAGTSPRRGLSGGFR